MGENETSEENQPKTIDHAIDACDKIISGHKFSSRLMLGLLGGVVLAFYSVFNILDRMREKIVGFGSLSGVENPGPISEFTAKAATYPYIIFGLFLATFGIIVALYRFHITEISRNEQIKLGFWRIRVAARNNTPGLESLEKLDNQVEELQQKISPLLISLEKDFQKVLGFPIEDAKTK